MSEIVDSTVVDEQPEASTEIVPVAPVLAVTPQVEAAELVQRLDVIRDAMDSAMTEDVDYGVIPGTNKPTLLKPGSEKLGVLFQLDVQLVNEKVWGPDEHLTVISHATVFHAPTGARLGYGEGVCTTRERKYAKRKQERVCPSCGTAAIIKGREEYGGGWVCFKKKNGCGANFKDGDGAIEGQDVGEIDNPDLPDLWNTVVKMAEKRARIDAVLAVTGASALFTQDAEDLHPQTDKAVEASTSRRQSSGAVKPSEGQRKFIKSLVEQKKPNVAQLKAILAEVGVNVEIGEGWVDKLSGGQQGSASHLIERLKEGPLPEVALVEPAPDLPEDAPVHPPVGDTSDLPFEAAA